MSTEAHRGRILACVFAAALWAVPACAAGGEPALRVASGTIVVDIGLADELARRFTDRGGSTLEIRAVGSGEAEALARVREVDALLVHEPSIVRRLEADGMVAERAGFMRTSYVLTGPPGDRAGVREAADLADAFRRIASVGERFVSRGDDSGTHEAEMRIWRRAGIRPAEGWYVTTGQGQADTLRIAAERDAYALTDAATLATLGPRLGLGILLSNEPPETTDYEVVALHGGRSNDAATLARFLGSNEVARLVDRWAAGRRLAGTVDGISR